MGGQKPPPPRF